jgi:hypothetical protein
MLQRPGGSIPEPCAAGDLAFGRQPAKLSPQLLRCPTISALSWLMALTLAIQAL